ncbi:hypothetical protein SAMN05443549_101735 [Flavobacterium fluvii]|uniref:Uncharacterized protein n=1 Tax=Flavobacterium fluvii TaxID=468056 RepID=A0A1M5FDB2_9FLAO|nr:hypothetical protein [Flavobacterium fluvii]SHF89479.1 hypothetical protein SAMN05443549_101735 [Flavobacterium fluvii]
MTDAELLELEILLIEKYCFHEFGKIYHNEMTNEIIAFSDDLKHLLKKEYVGRFKTLDNKIIMSLDLFNLIKLRYFSRNESVIIEKLDTTLKIV